MSIYINFKNDTIYTKLKEPANIIKNGTIREILLKINIE